MIIWRGVRACAKLTVGSTSRTTSRKLWLHWEVTQCENVRGVLKEAACSAKPPRVNKVKDKNQIIAATNFTCVDLAGSAAASLKTALFLIKSGLWQNLQSENVSYNTELEVRLTEITTQHQTQLYCFPYQIIKDFSTCFGIVGVPPAKKRQ